MTTITLPRATVEQALKTLEAGTDVDPIFAGETEAALRAALAQQAEPVAWMVTYHGVITEKFQDKEEAENFYRAMQANYPQDAAHRKLIPLYTAPPQRKPLTEEEIYRATGHCGVSKYTAITITRAVERAHGIKE